ncbi:MAG: ribonuclease P protein component [Acidobacteriaceae bacterium]
MIAPIHRLRKHADYQQVYKASRKHSAGQTSYFFRLRPPPLKPAAPPERDPNPNPHGARVGITVGKVIGNAVDRNRIKRRLRAAVRKQLPLLSAPVDVVLHPKRSAIEIDFATLEREVAAVFRSIQQAADRRSHGAPAIAP